MKAQILLAAGTVLVLCIRSPAATTPAKAMLENLAQLAVASRWCKDYSVDVDEPLLFSIQQGVNPMKLPYKKEFDDAKEVFELLMGEAGVNKFCSITYDRFRPGGVVPGFMMKR